MKVDAWPWPPSSLRAGPLSAASTVVMAAILFVEVTWFQSVQLRDYLFSLLVAVIASLLCFVVPHLMRRLVVKTWVIACASALAMVAVPVIIWHTLHFVSMLTFDADRLAWSSVWGLALNVRAQTIAGIALVVQMLAFASVLVQRSRKN